MTDTRPAVQPAAIVQQSSTQPSDAANSDKKRCQRCNDKHLLRMFPRRKSAPDGRGPLCYACQAEVNAERWPRKPR